MKQFEAAELPSNRKFGLFMAAIFALLAGYLVATHRAPYSAPAALVAVLLAAAAALKPQALAPLNKAWMTLGAAMGHVMSPIALAILFFAVFTPVALVMRLAGRDELRLRRAPASNSYWRDRTPPGPSSDSFRRQY